MSEPLRYRDAPARRAAILELLTSTGHLTIAEVAEYLAVSEMTARRDLKRLAEEAGVSAVRGGIRLASVTDLAPSEFDRRVGTEAEAKVRVGMAAAEMVGDDDIIAIDAGTTAFQAAQHLPSTFHGTVVTHSIPVIDLLMQRPTGRIIALGGEIHRPSKAVVGSSTIANAKGLRVATLFLGAGGVDERGVYASADVECGVKHVLMSIADRVVLLIDHRKFTTPAPVLMCDWSKIDVVVCDRLPEQHLARIMQTAEVQVLTTSAPQIVKAT